MQRPTGELGLLPRASRSEGQTSFGSFDPSNRRNNKGLVPKDSPKDAPRPKDIRSDRNDLSARPFGEKPLKNKGSEGSKGPKDVFPYKSDRVKKTEVEVLHHMNPSECDWMDDPDPDQPLPSPF
jgi:hypothetical protein